jgi:UDP-N-acetylglucosamine diphosphorylase/glucosamine-1-phosphate N-acetyltransferase
VTPHICIFEDAQVDRLFPLVYFRPVCNLKCGINSLREKIVRAYPKASASLQCRSYLVDTVQARNPKVHVNDIPADSCLFINGRTVAGRDLAKKIPLNGDKETMFMSGDVVVAVRVSGARLSRLKGQLGMPLSAAIFDDMPRIQVDVKTITYPWDLVQNNGRQLVEDFEALVGRKKMRSRRLPGCYLLGKDRIFIDPSATIKPGVVLDAEKGPIYIDRNATVLPQTSIVGPVYVGQGSVVRAGSTIYENTSIGPVCKVGGEVEDTIIQGYSNKQHSGFLGHSYIGAWVNLGAGTNNSDLKNNYGPVKVQLGPEQIDTGLQFVGLTMGDHSKSAINSQFNTGTVVGVSSNIFGSGFPPKYVPSFSWGAAGETFTTYQVERAIDVARRVMKRRQIELTAAEETLFRTIFDITSIHRRKQGMPG